MSSKSFSLEEHILTLVCSVFDAYSAVLFLPEENSDKHYLAASFSLGNHIPGDITISPGKTLVGRMIISRKHLLVPSVEPNKDIPGYYEDDFEEGIKSFMGFPIPTGGVLGVDSKRQYAFSEKDNKILQLFAELLARQQSLAQIDIGSDIPRYFAELGVIQDLRFRYRQWPNFLKNFLRAISKATEFDYCAFATLQEDKDYYSLECESAPLLLANGQELQLPLGSGITGWVFTHEQAVFADPGSMHSNTALFGKLANMPAFPVAVCMPVMINKSCRGVLCLANSEPRQIDESMRGFIRQSVDHLSLFLENLYLKNRISHLLPRANLENKGARIYDPDNAPLPIKNEDDSQE